MNNRNPYTDIRPDAEDQGASHKRVLTSLNQCSDGRIASPDCNKLQSPHIRLSTLPPHSYLLSPSYWVLFLI